MDFRQTSTARSSCLGSSQGRRTVFTPLLNPVRGSNAVTAAVKVREGKPGVRQNIVMREPLRTDEHVSAREPAAEVSHPGTYDRATSRFLVSTIMGARSWQELEALAHAYSVSFNHVHVSALVCRLPKVVDPAQLSKPESCQFSRFLREVSHLVTVRLSTFDSRGIANVLWAVSKLGYSPAPPTLNKFLFEAYVRMLEFNAQELANLAWALATLAELGNRPVPVWLRKYTLAAVPRVPELKPQELAHMAWALSKLFPQDEVVGAAKRAGADLEMPCGSAEPRGTAPAGAISVGQPSSNNHPSASEAVLVSAGGCSSRASSQAISDRDDTPAEQQSASASTASQIDQPAAGLPALTAALTSHATSLLFKFRCGELVMTVAALHSLDPSSGLRLLRLALPHLLRTASTDLSPQDLAMLWQVLGKCAADSTLSEELLQMENTSYSLEPAGSPTNRPNACVDMPMAAAAEAPAASVAADGGSLAARPVGQTGTACAASEGLGSLLGRHYLHALLDITARALHGFTAQGLCLVLWSWARLRLQPSDAAAHALFQRFHQVLPAQATFQGIAISLWAAAQLQLRPDPATMEVLVSCARLQAPASKPGELAALLWALQHLRYRPSRKLMMALNSRLREVVGQLPAEGLQGVLRAYTVFGAHVPRQVRDRALAVAASVAAANVRTGGEPVDMGVPPASSALMAAEALEEPSSAASLPAAAVKAAQVSVSGASATSTLLMRPPGAVVRYFATLAGVGIALQPVGPAKRVAEKKVQMLRWKLENNSELRHALRAAIESSMQGRLGELDTEALCALLASLVRLHVKPRAAFLKEVHDQVTERAGRLAYWQAGGLLASLGRLRSRPPAEVVAMLLAALEPHFDAMTDSQLLSVVEALARLRFRPSRLWMQHYFEECMARANTWPAASLFIFLRSLALLKLQLTESPCRKLQVVVLRWKTRKGRRAAKPATAETRPSAKRAAEEPDLKRTLCTVCSELEGCSI